MLMMGVSSIGGAALRGKGRKALFMAADRGRVAVIAAIVLPLNRHSREGGNP